jgi:hypothetical protein
MNLPSSRIAATFAAVLVSFALAGCGEADSTDTGSEELAEKSTQTPPSKAPEETPPHTEVGDPDLGFGTPPVDATDNTKPSRVLPQ